MLLVIGASVAWLIGYLLMMPAMNRVARGINKDLSGATGSALLRLLIGYVCTLIYSVLVIIYAIHIHHPVLIVLFIVPVAASWLLQLKEKVFK